MLELFALLPSFVYAAFVTVFVATSSPTALASTAAPEDQQSHLSLDEEIAALSDEEREELFVFVAGNALFTLYHEGGHMLVSELELPVLAQEEDAVDNLATVSMLSADTDDMDLFLKQAMIGWFLIAEEAYEDLIFYDEHDLDQQRGYRMLCLMVGADEEDFLELALELDLPEERIETCGFDYEQAADSWEVVTDPYVREEDGRGGKIKVKYEPAPDGLKSMEVFIRESGLLELVAEELDTFYELPEEVTFLAATCDEENAFWDPQTREVILCHELLGGFASIYLSLPSDDQAAD